jgi:hypothetical protein
VLSATETRTGACETRICVAGGCDAIGASSAASLSAASVAALSVLRRDDEVLLLRVCSAAEVRARSRAKRPLSRSTDSGSESADCPRLGNLTFSWGGKTSRSSGMETSWESESLGGREVVKFDGIGVALCVEDVTGEVVKIAGLAGRRLSDTKGNESVADGGRETGRLLRIELGVCGREIAE